MVCVVERDLSIPCKMFMVQFSSDLAASPKAPHYPLAAPSLSLDLLWPSCPDWDLCLWMGVRLGLEREGGRGVAGDELTGYYWICGGLVHKSPLSPTASVATTEQIR